MEVSSNKGREVCTRGLYHFWRSPVAIDREEETT